MKYVEEFNRGCWVFPVGTSSRLRIAPPLWGLRVCGIPCGIPRSSTGEKLLNYIRKTPPISTVEVGLSRPEDPGELLPENLLDGENTHWIQLDKLNCIQYTLPIRIYTYKMAGANLRNPGDVRRVDGRLRLGTPLSAKG